MECSFDLKKQADGRSELWTREFAKQIRNGLNDVLENAGSNGVVVINADGIKVFDFSFANEFFGKSILSLSSEYPGRILLVENLDEYTEENLVETLKSLNIAMLNRKNGEIFVIGKLHSAYIETFFLIYRAAVPLTANNVGENMGITATAANERLTKLTELGLMRRKKDVSNSGREIYVYSTIS